MSERIMTLSVSFEGDGKRRRRHRQDRRFLWRLGGPPAICWARSCATTSGDNSSSNGSADFATSSRAFLPYADSLRLRRSTLHETTRRADHHRAVHTPRSTSRRFFLAEIVLLPVASLPEPGDQRRRLAG